MLSTFFNIPSNRIGWYLLPFAAGNFLGPLLLGRLFDTIGRRAMIAFTYGISGVLLARIGLSLRRRLSHRTNANNRVDGDLLLCLAGRERGLPDGERDVSARSPGIGDRDVLCRRDRDRRRRWPALFGALIDSGSRDSVFAGYCLGSALMIAAALIGWRYGIAAERRSLELVASPLAVVES